jgi:hypothetical protein
MAVDCSPHIRRCLVVARVKVTVHFAVRGLRCLVDDVYFRGWLCGFTPSQHASIFRTSAGRPLAISFLTQFADASFTFD